MKAIKYLFIAALTAGYSASATAQDGTKADVQAVKNIISSKPADLDKQMKPYYKANKKNAENLVAFGREFYLAKDTANAKVYANHALVASKNKSLPSTSRPSIKTPRSPRLTTSMLTYTARSVPVVLSANWRNCAHSAPTLLSMHSKVVSTTCLTTSTLLFAPTTRPTRLRWKTATSATTL